jgi:ubiquinone/menaquinone biosynthesis C-methylase UbiE
MISPAGELQTRVGTDSVAELPDVLQDPEYLRTVAYANASKLQARINFWRKYGGEQRRTFGGGLCEAFRPPSHAKILEVGCGTGEFWSILGGDIDANWSLTLSDLTRGMVEECRSTFARLLSRPGFLVADLRNLPFALRTFDSVVANHMLYHLPDVDRGIGELARVLRAGGTLFATTFGSDHLREIRCLQKTFATVSGSGADSISHVSGFSLENGAELLRRHFEDVAVHRQADSITVTSAQDLVLYMESMTMALDVAALRRHLDSVVNREGCITITRSSGYFIATRPSRSDS